MIKIQLVPLLLTSLSIFIGYFHEELLNNFKSPPQRSPPLKIHPTFWLIGENGSTSFLTVIDTVLTRLNFDRIESSLDDKNSHENWNLLWSYRLNIPMNWSKLEYHQKFNHFPGNHYLASKSILATSTVSKYIPKAFTNSKKLQKFADENENKKFVVKLKTNRGVEVKDVSELNFTQNDNFFVQEFVENPLLFNGHKFDFAVYVVITSVDPLRVYYYTKNILMRFCPKKYDKNDLSDLDSYVVSPTNIPVAEFNGTREYYDNGYTYREAFEGFLTSIGADVRDVWNKVEDCVRSIVMTREKFYISQLAKVNASKFNFFELYRFDFILDDKLNLFLIEANQSPNLSPRGRYQKNRHLYENLVYNLFNLISIGTSYKKSDLKFPSLDEQKMVANFDSVNVKAEICMKCEKCNEECRLCWKCLNQRTKYEWIVAFKEQMNLGYFKRLFPPTSDYIWSESHEFLSNLKVMSDNSLMQLEWFTEMCKKNRHFC